MLGRLGADIGPAACRLEKSYAEIRTAFCLIRAAYLAGADKVAVPSSF